MPSTRLGPAPQGPPRHSRRPPGWWPLPAALACSLLAASGPAFAADGVAAGLSGGWASGLGPWLFGSVALLLVGLGAHALGSLRATQRQAAAVRSGLAEARLLTQLLDAWHWQTDAAHQLLSMLPPTAAPPGAGGVAASGPLWSRYAVADTADQAGLRARLESHVPLADLRVTEPATGSSWVLHALPRFDDSGRFAGYTGTARATAADDARGAEHRALQAFIELQPGAALMAQYTPGAGWALRQANQAAGRLLGSDGSTTTRRWEDLLPHLPAALRQALATPPSAGTAPGALPVPADSAGHDGWHARQLPGPGALDQWLLLVQAGGAEPAPADNPSESESFAYTVSHDLRAPIRVVEGFTRILKEDYGHQFDRVGNDHLDRVLGAAARMNHMIDALLTLARLSSLPLARQPVNLSQLAGFIVDDLRRGAPERAADIDIEAGLEVTGDPTLLRLVLENLLGNAWKYSARVKRTKIVFGTEQQDGRRVYVVRDNGAGFDMRSADRLFGLFQRLHSANDFPGTGVGLASVQRIVRRHGGQIWADAEPGRGAAFHFTLRA